MGWTIRRAEPADITGIIDLYNALFPKTGKTLEWWKWWYEENPAGSGYATVAVNGEGLLGGVLCMTPVRLSVCGDEVRVGQDSVGLIHPDAQRQGLFGLIARELHAQEAVDLPFQFCFCNDKSRLAYVKHLASNDHGAGAFHTAPATETGALKSYGIATGAPFGAAHDRLWARVQKRTRIAQQRDAVYLNWRFRSNRDSAYINADIYQGDDLLGVLIFQPFRDRLDLLDYMWHEGEGLGDLRPVLEIAGDFASQQGYKRLAFWTLDLNVRAVALLDRLGFRREERNFHLLSRRLQPIPIAQTLQDFTQWECTAGDLELF